MDVPIEVPLPDSLQKALQKPICIPLPKPGSAQIQLPTGGTLKGIVDITKGIPDDCSLNFSLVLQLAPVMASIECLVKVLKLIKPLIDVVKALGPPDPPTLIKVVPEFLQAAEAVLPCLAVPTPAVMIPFVRDILLLIIKLLKCIVGQLKSILAVMGGLALQISSAQAEGNSELMAALECAQANANASAQHMMSAIDPVLVLLALAEPFMGIAGVAPIKTPAIGSAEDIESLQNVVTTLDDLTKALQLVADALGG
ncbi:hypothetical protein ACIP1U_16900 [Cupriavidus sp. NPDC089707]|uniref:hypothetical protein n=1 Tax=Cupriavidus sp. NPDC089707 TaxID=3363963 RepID=UPI0037FFBCCE